jgi:hypothetical protein
MSFRTQFLALLFVSAVISAGVTRAATASSRDESQEKLGQALNDFYEAISKSPDKSPSTVKKLDETIVAPAEQEAMKAVFENTRKALEKSTQTAPVGKANPSKSGEPDKWPYTKSTISEPETVLEGTDIPAELEFPGAPKVPLKPSPYPSNRKK